MVLCDCWISLYQFFFFVRLGELIMTRELWLRFAASALLATVLTVCFIAEISLSAEVYNPIQFGTKPDGKTLSTTAIQKAIDTCAAAGGGTVQLTKGNYLSGTIFFRSGVTLQLDEGVRLFGSTDLNDYPHKTPDHRSMMDYKEKVTQSLIYAERVEKIALRGKGEINGQGASFRLCR